MSISSIIVLILVFGVPLISKVVKKYGEWQKNSADHDRDELGPQTRFDSDVRIQQSQQPDLANMTMAQRIELARQRARQTSLGALQDMDAQTRAQREALARQQHAEQARRQQAALQQQQRQQAARQQAARRRAEEEAHRRRSAVQRQGQQPSSRQPQQPPVARVVSRSQQRAARAAPACAASKRSSPVVSGKAPVARVKSSSDGRRTVGGVSKLPAILGGVSLKQAFVLKEMLDKPLALRDPAQEHLW